MVFDKKTWVDRQSQYPNRRILTDTTSGTAQTVTVERDEGTVDVVGHPFNAANMNDLEDRVDNGFTTIQENFQDGVDSVYDACVSKGSTPTSHSLADVVTAIENISGGDVNMFGTPDSNTPEGGAIVTQTSSVITGHEAYKAFGDNENGWVADTIGSVARDTVEYSFTNGSSYRPTKLQFCSKFDPDGAGSVVCAIEQVLASTDGETWDTLATGPIYSQNKDDIVTINFDTNSFYSKFRFVCVSEIYSYVGLKNLKCWGEKEGGSGAGIPFPKMEFFNSIIRSYGTEEEVKWIGMNAENGGGQQSPVFVPNNDENTGFCPFTSRQPFKIHIRFAFDDFQAMNCLCGAYSNYYNMPSIELGGDESIYGLYSTTAGSWTNGVTLEYNFQPNTIYIVEYGWDGTQLFLKLFDATGQTLLGEVYEPENEVYDVVDEDVFEFGAIHGGGNVSNYGWFDIYDTYIEVGDEIIWGNRCIRTHG